MRGISSGVSYASPGIKLDNPTLEEIVQAKAKISEQYRRRQEQMDHVPQ